MEKNDLIDIIRKVLKTDTDLGFLVKLKTHELETLVACIRDRVETFAR